MQAPASAKAGLRSSPATWVCIPGVRRDLGRAVPPGSVPEPGLAGGREGGAAGTELLGAAGSSALTWEHLRRQLTQIAVTNRVSSLH